MDASKITSTFNKRGRAYICATPECSYVNERRRVVAHIYKEHLPVEDAPFYCTLCGYRTTTRRDLNNHVVGYKKHLKAVREAARTGSMGDESDYLVSNPSPRMVTDNDLKVLDKGVSEFIFEQRSKKSEVKISEAENLQVGTEMRAMEKSVEREVEVKDAVGEDLFEGLEVFPTFEDLLKDDDDDVFLMEARTTDTLVKSKQTDVLDQAPTVKEDSQLEMKREDPVSIPSSLSFQSSHCDCQGTAQLLTAAITSLNEGMKVLKEGLAENRRMLEEGLEANKRASERMLRTLASQEFSFRQMKTAMWDLNATVFRSQRLQPVPAYRRGSFIRNARSSVATAKDRRSRMEKRVASVVRRVDGKRASTSEDRDSRDSKRSRKESS